MIRCPATSSHRPRGPTSPYRAPPRTSDDPAEEARQLMGRPYLSPSSIASYVRCPLGFRFKYVDGLAPGFVSSSLLFGKGIHAALEAHFRRLFEGAEPPGVDELVATYEGNWATEPTAPVRFGKGESTGSLRDLACRVLQAFLDSPVSKLDGRLVGVEEEFRSPLVPGCPDLLGIADLVLLTDQALRVVDFKTARSRWNEAKIREASPQMLTYGELVKPLARDLGNRPIQLQWVILTKAKDPAVETHTLKPNPRQVRRLQATIGHVWGAIRARRFYPAPSSASCSTCPFGTPCQKWEG